MEKSAIVATLQQYSTPQLVALGTATLSALLLLRVIYSLYFHPLASYPGPWLARSGLPLGWSFIQGIKGRSIWALQDVHSRYGDWVRIGYNELSCLDPKAVPVLYSASSKWRKSSYYDAFQEPAGRPNIFSTTDNNFHAYLKRITSTAFTMNSLLTIEPRVQTQAVALCEMLEERYAKTGETCDISQVLLYMAADVVGALGFGQEHGFNLVKTMPKRSEMIEIAGDNQQLSHRIGCNRVWGPRLWHSLGALFGTPPGIKQVWSIAHKGVAERRKRHAAAVASGVEADAVEDVNKDMISYWIKTKDPKTGEILTDAQIAANSMLLLMAGSDTTATTMRALLMYVLTTPGVREKVVAELDEAFESGACSWPPRHSETIRLEYFQGCVKEALRMWPAVGWVMARVAPTGGSHIGDKYFPSGISVGVPAPHYHRSAEHAFGDKPDEYRPERWIGGTEEQRRLRDANLLSFGGGTRLCTGRSISLLEISIAFPMILRKFDFKLVPRAPKDGPADRFGKGSEHHTWKVSSTWFSVQSEMYVKISNRDGGVA